MALTDYPTSDSTKQTAKLFALAARNGVEDLHVEGAFEDDEAPALNRAIRNRIYEALLALQIASSDDPVQAGFATDWLIANADLSSDDPLEGALPRAAERGIHEFAESANTSPDLEAKLIAAGRTELLEAIALYRKVLDGDPTSQRELGILQMMVPDYWEDPQASSEFMQALRPEGGAP